MPLPESICKRNAARNETECPEGPEAYGAYDSLRIHWPNGTNTQKLIALVIINELLYLLDKEIVFTFLSLGQGT